MSEPEGPSPKPESEDTQPKPAPASATKPKPEPDAPVRAADVPTAPAPIATSPAADDKRSSPDSGWDSVLGSKSGGPSFAPPAVASKTPAVTPSVPVPTFVAPTGKPRTSESNAAVSGEFGRSGPNPSAAPTSKLADDDPAKPGDDDKAEPASADDEAEPPDDDEAESGDDDEAESDDDERDDDAAATRREPINEPDSDPASASASEPTPEPEGGSPNFVLILAIAAVIVGAVIWASSSDPSGTDQHADTNSSRPNTPDKTPEPSKQAERPRPRPPEVKTHAADPKLEALRQQQALAAETDSGAETDTGEQLDEDPPTEPGPKRGVTDPRDPSLIPAGTPAENAKAFTKLPVSVSDGPPLGGIGRNGIHIDGVSMAAGRDNNECDDPTRSFSTIGTEFINVCVRVVHSRAQDTLRVIWEKDGTVTRRGKVRIPENLHAYKTRAYLQVRPEYVGSWRVRIVPEGEEDTDLAVAQFTIE